MIKNYRKAIINMKTMKSVLAVFLAVLMLFSMFAVSVSAAGYNKVTVSVNKTEANVGDVIKVTVGVKADSNLVTFQGVATYNTEYFQLVEGSVTTGGIFGFEEPGSPAGKVTYASASGAPVTKAGTLISFELKVLKTGGTINFAVEEAYIDDNGVDKDVTSEIGSASFTIKAPKCAHKNVTTDRKEPTCMTDGYETKICKDCGEQISKKVLSASGAQHKMGDYKVTKEATCSQEGSSEATCSVCGHKDVQKLSKTAHKYGDFTVTKEATCTSEGTKTAKCSVCGETKKESIPKKAHSFDPAKDKVTKEPTCTETGTKQSWCNICKKYINNGTIDALGHVYEETIVEATCEQPSGIIQECSRCNEREFFAYSEDSELYAPAKGHTYGDWVVEVEPTETTEGLKSRECSTCGNREIEIIVFEKPEITPQGTITIDSYSNRDAATIGSGVYFCDPNVTSMNSLRWQYKILLFKDEIGYKVVVVDAATASAKNAAINAGVEWTHVITSGTTQVHTMVSVGQYITFDTEPVSGDLNLVGKIFNADQLN